MIEVDGLVKHYGPTRALDGLSFTARPGTVTGFLGPNGAGKSTSLRILLGLDRADAGTATVAGRRYADLRAPLHLVGSLLDARAVAPRLSARAHLLALARSNGIGARRVGEVLATCGLEDAARRPVGGFSLGMSQRLGLAGALLGDPAVLVLDEPVNGLDPEGVIWIRELLRELAGEGRTVLLSSHVMSEMAVTAHDLVVIGRGRLLAQTTVADVTARAEGSGVRVRTPDPRAVADLLRARGLEVTPDGPPDDDGRGALWVRAGSTDEVGRIAAEHGVTLLELSARQGSLEDAYLQLTAEVAQYRGRPPATDVPGNAATGAGAGRAAA
ncbi:ABC transporter ATP-binding protein [Geodermatophilus sp. SYSU D00710]